MNKIKKGKALKVLENNINLKKEKLWKKIFNPKSNTVSVKRNITHSMKIY